MNNRYKCDKCNYDCVSMRAKDWHPEEDKYNPEAAIVWFGWCIVAMIFGALMWWVLG